MEMFIDAYNWVMTPNVYGRSQFVRLRMLSSRLDKMPKATLGNHKATARSYLDTLFNA